MATSTRCGVFVSRVFEASERKTVWAGDEREFQIEFSSFLPFISLGINRSSVDARKRLVTAKDKDDS